MSTIEISTPVTSRNPARRRLSAALRTIVAPLIRRWQRAEALRSLKRQSPYMLRDMGFEPDDIYGARPSHLDGIDAVRISSRRQ